TPSRFLGFRSRSEIRIPTPEGVLPLQRKESTSSSGCSGQFPVLSTRKSNSCNGRGLMIIRDAELRDARGIAEELFRRGARTLSQDLDRHFESLPLLVQGRHLQFDPCDRGDLSAVDDWRLEWWLCSRVSRQLFRRGRKRGGFACCALSSRCSLTIFSRPP